MCLVLRNMLYALLLLSCFLHGDNSTTAQQNMFDWNAFRENINIANPGLNLPKRNFQRKNHLVKNITGGISSYADPTSPPMPDKTNSLFIVSSTASNTPNGMERENAHALKDASLLSDAPLLFLTLKGTSITNLDFLAKGKLNNSLVSLIFMDHDMKDFSVLAKIPHLKNVSLGNLPNFRNLSVLGEQTSHVFLWNTGISDLDFTTPSAVKVLFLYKNQSLRSLDKLVTLSNLRSFDLWWRQLPQKLLCPETLSHISFVNCDGTSLPELSLPKIKTLKLIHCDELKDLSNLQGKKIGYLGIDQCKFMDDLSCLCGFDIEFLSIGFFPNEKTESRSNYDIELMKTKLRPLLECDSIKGIDSCSFCYKYEGKLRDVRYLTDEKGNKRPAPASYLSPKEIDEKSILWGRGSTATSFTIVTKEDAIKAYE